MTLIDDVKNLWKLYSVWAFTAIGAFPDVYNGIASMGWADEIPPTAKWLLRGLAGFGIFLRVMKQRKGDDNVSKPLG